MDAVVVLEKKRKSSRMVKRFSIVDLPLKIVPPPRLAHWWPRRGRHDTN